MIYLVPIYKSREISSVENFRPISVLNCLSKIIERLVYNHVFSFLMQEKLIYLLQSGFRHGHSTATVLIHLIDLIYKDVDTSAMTGAIFLDIRKAFDTVDHHILLSKLKQLNPDYMMHKWLTSYLTSREQVVDFKRVLSSSAKVTMGVPQGSIPGPLLFLLYVNDLPSQVSSRGVILFANDTTTLSHC